MHRKKMNVIKHYKAKTAAITTAEEIRKTLESFEAKIEEAKANVTLKR